MILDYHVCVLFNDIHEFPALCASILLETRKRGDYAVLVSNGDDAYGIGCSVAGLNLDISVPAASFGMREIPIVVKSIIERLRELAESKMAGGERGVTFFLDMSWLLHTPSGIAHLGEFEASLHKLVTTSKIRAVCLFNKRCFPEALILDVLRTHPYVLDTEGLRYNPHFLPPHVYLSGDQAAQLECWMASLGPVVHENGCVQANLAGQTIPASACESLGVAGAQRAEIPDKAPQRQQQCQAMGGQQDGTQQRWKIRCLGKLRIYRQDGTPVRWDLVHGATIKTKTLFALLLQSGSKGIVAEEIADLLWPESSSMTQSLNRLYHTVHCLRIALEPKLSSRHESSFLICNDHRYYLKLPEGTWIDAPIFEQFCRRGEQLLKTNYIEDSLACHQVAERLYSGRLFMDIPDKYADNAEIDWCWGRRYWLEEMYVKMLTYMARIYRDIGDANQAAAYAEKALRIEPCYEPAHQEAIRAFHALGRHDAIDRQYRLCWEALKRYEMRAPSSETRVLFQSLFHGLT